MSTQPPGAGVTSSQVMQKPKPPPARAMPSYLLNAIGDAVRFAAYMRDGLLVTVDEPHYTYVLLENGTWSSDNMYIRAAFAECNRWYAGRVEGSSHPDWQNDGVRNATTRYLRTGREAALERRLKECLLQLEGLATDPLGFDPYTFSDWQPGDWPEVLLAKHNELNASRGTLPFANGVVDLRGGPSGLRLMDPADAAEELWTVHSDLDWRKATTQDVEDADDYWDNYGDSADYFRSAFADSLLGYYDQGKILHLIVSPPDTGKTGMFNVLQTGFGSDMVHSLSNDVLAQPTHGQPANEPGLLNMRTSRIAYTDEAEEVRFNVPRLKALSGDSSLSATYKYENQSIEFRFKGRLFILANEVPRKMGTSDTGLANRLWAIRTSELKRLDRGFNDKDPVLAMAVANNLMELAAELYQRHENGESSMDVYDEFREINEEFKEQTLEDEHKAELDYLRQVLEPSPERSVLKSDLCAAAPDVGVLNRRTPNGVLENLLKRAFALSQVDIKRTSRTNYVTQEKVSGAVWVNGFALTETGVRKIYPDYTNPEED